MTNSAQWCSSDRETCAEVYDRIAAHIANNRTTLVFVNTRRLSERVAHALGERLGEDAVLRTTAVSRGRSGSMLDSQLERRRRNDRAVGAGLKPRF